MSRAWCGSSSTRGGPGLLAGGRQRASTASAMSPSKRTRSTTSATPKASSASTRCGCVSPRGGETREATPSLAQVALRFEPAHHDPVESVGMLDIGEMAGVGDFLVAAAGNEPTETLVLAWRRAGILGTADHEGRNAQRRQLGCEVETHDRSRAPEISGRCGCRDGVADLLPSIGFPRLE